MVSSLSGPLEHRLSAVTFECGFGFRQPRRSDSLAFAFTICATRREPLAARTGATTKELMVRLGHSSPRASMNYQHAAADRDRLIVEGLDAMTVEAGLVAVVPIDKGRSAG
jgi:hypothetical protein